MGKIKAVRAGKRRKTKLYWAPRVAAIVFIGFISLFSLDVFSGEGSLIEMLGGFVIHLIPSIITLFSLTIAWSHDLVGGILFLTLAAIFSILFLQIPLALYLLLIAGLFFLNSLQIKGGSTKKVAYGRGGI